MKKSKKIFLSIFIILLIIAVAVLAVFLVIKSKEDDDKKNDEELKWGDVYLKVLKDENIFEDLNNIRLQLCDLNNDKIPELVAFGSKVNNKVLAKVFNINKNKEVDTMQFELTDDFEMEFLYNEEEKTYNWYAVTEDDEVYDLKIEDKNYEVNESEYDYEDDFEVVSIPEKIDFDPEEDEPKDVMGELEDSYSTEPNEILEDEGVELGEAIKKEYDEDSEEEDQNKDNSEDNEKENENDEEDNHDDEYGEGVGDDGSYMGYFYSFVQSYKANSYKGEYELASETQPKDVYYLFFADLDLNDIPEMYVLSEDDQYYNTRQIYLVYENGQVTDSMGPYMSDTIKLVKNEDGEYCYFESELDYEGKDYDCGVDTSFLITNIETREHFGISYRPQSPESVPYKLETMSVDDIGDYSKFNWTDITMEKFREYAKEYKDEYENSGEEDLIEEYRVKLDEYSDSAILDAMPEAYSNYEEMMEKIK